MNKSQLIDSIALKAELSKKDSHKVLDAFLSTITETLSLSEEVAIAGFGTFKISHRAARLGKNPKTGEALQIKAAKVPSFKAGKLLKESVK
jgi:DNA-binding protein HU-beta